MRLFFLAMILFFAAFSQADIKVQDCGTGYGPAATNLIAILDDEGTNDILRMGYQTMGVFYEFRTQSCSKFSLANRTAVVCDGRRIGTVSQIFHRDDDLGYNGPQARISLQPELYDITGSCRNRYNPLTLTIKGGVSPGAAR